MTKERFLNLFLAGAAQPQCVRRAEEQIVKASGYSWLWFRNEIRDRVTFTEPHCRDLLDLLEEMDSIVGAIFARPTSPFSDRPQDYVVSILVARAFRLTVSSLYIGLGGYADSASNLDRTTWEIGIRLLDMTSQPIAAALGFLLDSAASEISHVQAELSYRQINSEPIHLLAKNLAVLQRHYELLKQATRDRHLDPDRIRRTHGRLNIREVCKRFDIEKAYLVDYAFNSAYVHEKNAASSEYVIEGEHERQFHLGPVGSPDAAAAMVFDVLMNMARVLTTATRIVQEKAIITSADRLLDKVVALRGS